MTRPTPGPPQVKEYAYKHSRTATQRPCQMLSPMFTCLHLPASLPRPCCLHAAWPHLSHGQAKPSDASSPTATPTPLGACHEPCFSRGCPAKSTPPEAPQMSRTRCQAARAMSQRPKHTQAHGAGRELGAATTPLPKQLRVTAWSWQQGGEPQVVAGSWGEGWREAVDGKALTPRCSSTTTASPAGVSPCPTAGSTCCLLLSASPPAEELGHQESTSRPTHTNKHILSHRVSVRHCLELQRAGKHHLKREIQTEQEQSTKEWPTPLFLSPPLPSLPQASRALRAH